MATVQYKKPTDESTPWQQRLVNYASDQNAGKTEYQRALEVQRAKSALGDTAGADAAKKWAGQVRTAVGEDAFNESKNTLAQLSNRINTPNPQYAALQKQIEQRLSQPVQQFNFNADTDATVQAQRQMVAQDTARDMNNARVEAGAVGMRGGSLQNNQLSQLSAMHQSRLQNELIPVAKNQAYQAWMDQQQLGNQQLGNMMSYANTLSDMDQRQVANALQVYAQQNQLQQQGFDNERALNNEQRQNKIDNQAIAQWYTQTFGVPVAPKQDWGLVAQQVQGLTPLAVQEFNEQRKNTAWEQNFRQQEVERAARQQAEQMGYNWAQLSQRDKEFLANQALQQQELDLRRQTSSGSQNVNAKDSADNYSIILSDLNSVGVTKEQAMRLAQSNKDYLSDADYRKLIDFINSEF